MTTSREDSAEIRMEHEQETIDLTKYLRDELTTILVRDFDLNIIKDLTICKPVVVQVVQSAQQAMNDMRNGYPNSISLIKYIANVCFWIIKLKPINVNLLMTKEGRRCADVMINEKAAIFWGLRRILDGVEKGKLNEILPATQGNILATRKIVDFYLKTNMFKKADGTDVANTTKFEETIHYCRYKKITSIYVYEIFMHLIIGQKIIAV